MPEFTMPILGADMETGTLLEWRVKPGDVVHRGDVIAEIETDKVNMEIEVYSDGVVERLLAEAGDRVPVGTPIAVIRGEGESETASEPAGAVPAPPVGTQPPAAFPQAVPRVPRAEPARGPAVSPAARRLAQEKGIDLTTIAGTGPGGRIQLEDVQRAAAAAIPATPADRASRMRQAIAATMTRSAREIPQFHVMTTIDMHRALEWLRTTNEQRSVADRLLYSVLLIKATALALHEVPELNAVWADDHVELKPAIHIGVAISLRGGGLVAPALHDADRRPLDDLMHGLQDLVQRARAGSLRSSEMAEPTVTVTNLGELGAEAAFGIIFPPQVALVGFGRVAERPWVSDGQVVARPLLSATLTADHRVLDGHRGSVFLAAVDRLLQEPEAL
jgi:pyruvate dehydrogenase E2 component (dihydrolipoamide acetyltransferase)